MKPDWDYPGEKIKVAIGGEHRPIAIHGYGTDQSVYHRNGNALGLAAIAHFSGEFVIGGAGLQILKCSENRPETFKLRMASNATQDLLTNKTKQVRLPPSN